jgi:hypothetical protein
MAEEISRTLEKVPVKTRNGKRLNPFRGAIDWVKKNALSAEDIRESALCKR